MAISAGQFARFRGLQVATLVMATSKDLFSRDPLRWIVASRLLSRSASSLLRVNSELARRSWNSQQIFLNHGNNFPNLRAA
jgi:hypothetical protein